MVQEVQKGRLLLFFSGEGRWRLAQEIVGAKSRKWVHGVQEETGGMESGSIHLCLHSISGNRLGLVQVFSLPVCPKNGD